MNQPQIEEVATQNCGYKYALCKGQIAEGRFIAQKPLRTTRLGNENLYSVGNHAVFVGEPEAEQNIGQDMTVALNGRSRA